MEISVDYDLVVDRYGLEIEFVEPYSPNGHYKSKVDYNLEYIIEEIHVISLILVMIQITIKLVCIPRLSSFTPSLDLTENQHGTVKVRVEVPVSVTGEVGIIVIKVQSSSSSNIMEEIDLALQLNLVPLLFLLQMKLL